MPFDSMHERYKRDPQFHRLVATMINAAEKLEFSPGELREAAVFAECMFQMRQSVRVVYTKKCEKCGSTFILSNRTIGDFCGQCGERFFPATGPGPAVP